MIILKNISKQKTILIALKIKGKGRPMLLYQILNMIVKERINITIIFHLHEK